MTKTTEKELLQTLQTLKESCEEALSGEWDRSDDGFEAMIYNLSDIIAKVKGK